MKNLRSEEVLKMFPVSFERPSSNDRCISEENLVDWFRGVTGDSCDLNKNSPYSFVVTDKIASQTFTFVLGGYHVHVKLSAFKDANRFQQSSSDIYAILSETKDNNGFRHVENGDSINAIDDTFYAVEFAQLSPGNIPLISVGQYRLHILSIDSKGNFSIPPESKRYSFTVDGGVV